MFNFIAASLMNFIIVKYLIPRASRIRPAARSRKAAKCRA
jgi:hypothetical protein